MRSMPTDTTTAGPDHVATPAGQALGPLLANALWARPVRRVVLPLLATVVLMGLWEAGVSLGGIPDYILPPPSAIYDSLLADLGSSLTWWNLWVTAEETLLGFACGVILGFILGLVVAEFPALDDALYPIIVAFQAMPKVAVAPLLLIWFGFGIGSKVAIAALLAFFPLLVNTVLGLHSSDPRQEELMQTLSARRWQMFSMVRFYNALPSIIAGLELAMVLAVIGAIVGEFVGARAGLGYMIQQRNADTDVAGIFSVLIILGVFGAVFTYAVKIVGARLVFWQRH
jgi:NitT/TauT family transport system permease protein